MPSRSCAREAGRCCALAPDARAVIDEALREGRGVIFASAHLGPWERVAASLVGRRRTADDARARELRPPLHAPLRAASRRVAASRVVLATPGSPGRWRQRRASCARCAAGASSASRWTCARVCPRARRPFLGHPATTPVGPARIALRTGRRGRRGYGGATTETPWSSRPLAFRRAAWIFGLQGPRRTRPDDAHQSRASRRILALPHAWVWMHERWTPSAEYDVNFG